MLIVEERGYFWPNDVPIPERAIAPDSAVAGTLKIADDDIIRLELDSRLTPARQSGAGNVIIQGILKSSDDRVLLHNASYGGGTVYKSNGISYEHFTAEACLIGRRAFASGNADLAFSKMVVSLQGFEEWLGLGSINVKVADAKFSAVYEPIEDFSYSLYDGSVSIQYDIYIPPFSMRTDAISVKERARLSYSFNESLTLTEIIAQFHNLEEFFIILTDSEYNMKWPEVMLGPDASTYHLYFPRSKTTSEPPEIRELITNFVQLRGFPSIHNMWKQKRAKFDSGFYLYTGTRRGMKFYAEHEFVNLIWGIETFHRAKYPELPASARLENKIKRIKGQIAKSADIKWISWCIGQAHVTEPNLETRIAEVLRTLPIELSEEGVKKFAHECAEIRNNVSHFGGRRRTHESYGESDSGHDDEKSNSETPVPHGNNAGD
jgi:ApeA-like protein/HEPN superfamily Apea-like protein